MVYVLKRPPIPRPPADFNPMQLDLFEPLVATIHMLEHSYWTAPKYVQRKIGHHIYNARQEILSAITKRQTSYGK